MHTRWTVVCSVFVVVARTEWTMVVAVVETDTVVRTAWMTAAALAVAVPRACSSAYTLRTASAFVAVRTACSAAVPSVCCARRTASSATADRGMVSDRHR